MLSVWCRFYCVYAYRVGGAWLWASSPSAINRRWTYRITKWMFLVYSYWEGEAPRPPRMLSCRQTIRIDNIYIYICVYDSTLQMEKYAQLFDSPKSITFPTTKLKPKVSKYGYKIVVVGLCVFVLWCFALYVCRIWWKQSKFRLVYSVDCCWSKLLLLLWTTNRLLVNWKLYLLLLLFVY